MNSPQQSPLKWRSASLLSVVALSIQLIAPVFAVAKDKGHKTQTPIQHVIVIIGENRTFDHVFATYKPPVGQKVDNLLSKGIIKADGTPGPNFKLAAQFKAWDVGGFDMSPLHIGPYKTLPPTNTQGTPTSPSDSHPAPFQTMAPAEQAEPGLLPGDYVELTTGASGLPQGVI